MLIVLIALIVLVVLVCLIPYLLVPGESDAPTETQSKTPAEGKVIRDQYGFVLYDPFDDPRFP